LRIDPDTQENLLHVAAPYADKEKIRFLCKKRKSMRTLVPQTATRRCCALPPHAKMRNTIMSVKNGGRQVLIKAGADREARNKEGQQAVDLLRPDMAGYRPMRDLLCPSVLGRVVRFVADGFHY
jgi:hypothetical protein